MIVRPILFRFAPKLTSAISHQRQLKECRGLTLEFCEKVKQLGNQLGPIWLLLPQSFSPVQYNDLERFVSEFPAEYTLAVELRHPEWYSNQTVNKKVFNLFERYGTIAIISDVAGRRDVLHQRITSPSTIIRFMGNLLHPTDFTRLDSWAERIHQWTQQGLEEINFFFHQAEEDLTVELAIHLH